MALLGLPCVSNSLDLAFRTTDFCLVWSSKPFYVLTTPPTLEPKEAEHDENGTPIAAVFNGLGATHQCRSWDIIHEARDS